MRVDGQVHIAGVGVVVPDGRASLEAALTYGVSQAGPATDHDVTKLPVVDPGQSAEELAVAAARVALANANLPSDDPRLLVHACASEDPAAWKAATRIARLVGMRDAVALGVRQMCNGGAIAAQIAMAQMLADPRLTSAVVLTSDALGWGAPHRWHEGLVGAALADSATGLVLARGPGPLSVSSIATRGSPELETTLPDHNPLRRGWLEPAGAVNESTKPENLFRLRRCLRTAITDACADAGLALDDPRLAAVVLPRVGSNFVRVLTEGLLRVAPTTEVVHTYAEEPSGHYFAGDLAANVAWVREQKLLGPGESAIVLSVGGGFTASCMVVRAAVEEHPPFTDPVMEPEEKRTWLSRVRSRRSLPRSS